MNQTRQETKKVAQFFSHREENVRLEPVIPDESYQPSVDEQLLEASQQAHARGMRLLNTIEIKEIAERVEQRESAGDLLEKWLAQPGTQRSVKRLVYTGGHFEIELSAGGFVYTSVTQTTLEGAIRNVLGAAAFDE